MRAIVDHVPLSQRRRKATAALGVLLVVGLWEVCGLAGVFGSRFLALSTIVNGLLSPVTGPVVWRATEATLPRAGLAFAYGATLGLVAALCQQAVPSTKPAVHRLAALLQALPVVVMAPVLVTIFGVNQVPVLIGALSAFFAIFVTLSSGFERTPKASLDMVSVFGGSPLAVFMRLRIPVAIPYLVDGLRLASVGALVGTMFGEWFGTSRGLGVLVVSAMQEFQPLLLWSSALVATSINLVLIVLFGGLNVLASRRFLT